MHQYNPQHFFTQVWIERQRFPHKVIYRRNCFHAGKAATGYYKSDQRLSIDRIRLGICLLQTPEDLGAESNCVRQRFHCQRQLGKTGKVVKVSDRSQCDHQMIVTDLLWAVTVATRNKDPLVRQINLVNAADQHLDPAEELAQGIDDVGDLEIARCNLVKHGCEQEKVIATNEANLRRSLSRHQFLKMDCGVNATETTAENDDSFSFRLTSHPDDH